MTPVFVELKTLLGYAKRVSAQTVSRSPPRMHFQAIEYDLQPLLVCFLRPYFVIVISSSL